MKRFLFLLLFATAAYAADPLIARLGDSATALKKGDYAKTLKIDERLIDDMIEQLGPGDAETKWFGVLVAHKALALAGLGREDDAVWYWHIALNIYPSIAESDMSMFGAPAELLKRHPLAPPLPEVRRVEIGDKKLPANVHAPAVLTRVEPRYAKGARAFLVSGIIIVECVIDKNGTVRDARIRKALPVPTLSYTALEALRQWRFQPATVDDKPVDVFFNLTINFKLGN